MSGWGNSMDEAWLQIHSYEGEGFQPLVAFNGWRVAILNYLDDIHPERNNTMERHTETDEVFVLTKGKGVLIIGGNGSQVDAIHSQTLEIGKICNVRRNTWHTILLSRDASVLIVEKRDTGEPNSEYTSLSAEPCRQIMKSPKWEDHLAQPPNQIRFNPHPAVGKPGEYPKNQCRNNFRFLLLTTKPMVE